MKIKFITIFLGIINAVFLSIAPVFVYNFFLSENLDISRSSDFALNVALGTICFILILNIIIISIIYRYLKNNFLKMNVFLHIIIAWIPATIILVFLMRNFLFYESESDPMGIAIVLGIIINFITLLMSIIISKTTTKFILKRL